ncbi:MAG: molybdate ABC transporter substrate-binding protein [Clostridiales Family XIII bacterium]|jgi:molybdate transport system substrate-binding protein|nr:molybdate ABC transporter substrate-binding protein [Clostridiales Family XIII bacterium]
MKRIIKKRSLLLILAVVIMLTMATLGACAKDKPANTDSADEPAAAEEAVTGQIMIAAAASLENALTEELIPLFNEEYPDVAVTGSYDSSGKLQEQIEGGLDAAIFFSAATKQMDALVDGGYIDRNNVVNLLENQIVLITSASSETKVASFEDITNAASIAIGDPAGVPAGQYAQEVLTSLGNWDRVSASASLGTNVTEVLSWVAEGSAEVGIVYATDAASMPDKVKVLATAPADSLKTPVVYPVETLGSVADANREAAESFVTFLQSDAAMAVFEKYGFKPAA